MRGSARWRFFDDFSEGETYRTPGRTVTEADVVAFAGLSGDLNSIHLDVQHARRAPLGDRVAHGLLTVSLAQGLASRTLRTDLSLVRYVALETEFRRPVRIGTTLRAELVVERMAVEGRHGRLVLGRRVLDDREDLVEEGRATLVLLREPVNG